MLRSDKLHHWRVPFQPLFNTYCRFLELAHFSTSQATALVLSVDECWSLGLSAIAHRGSPVQSTGMQSINCGPPTSIKSSTNPPDYHLSVLTHYSSIGSVSPLLSLLSHVTKMIPIYGWSVLTSCINATAAVICSTSQKTKHKWKRECVCSLLVCVLSCSSLLILYCQQDKAANRIRCYSDEAITSHTFWLA